MNQESTPGDSPDTKFKEGQCLKETQVDSKQEAETTSRSIPINIEDLLQEYICRANSLAEKHKEDIKSSTTYEIHMIHKLEELIEEAKRYECMLIEQKATLKANVDRISTAFQNPPPIPTEGNET